MQSTLILSPKVPFLCDGGPGHLRKDGWPPDGRGVPLKVCLLFLLISAQMMGCGAVGKPIAPEEVGIEAKVRKQQKEGGTSSGEPQMEEEVPPTETPEELPPFYPIGVR